MPPYFSKDFQMTDSKVEENMIHVTETGLKKILLQEASYGGRHGARLGGRDFNSKFMGNEMHRCNCSFIYKQAWKGMCCFHILCNSMTFLKTLYARRFCNQTQL